MILEANHSTSTTKLAARRHVLADKILRSTKPIITCGVATTSKSFDTDRGSQIYIE